MKTFTLADGKYEIDRDENGLITSMRRNGESWYAGMEALRHMGVFHAALNEIERLSALVPPSKPEAVEAVETLEIPVEVDGKVEFLPADPACMRDFTIRMRPAAIQMVAKGASGFEMTIRAYTLQEAVGKFLMRHEQLRYDDLDLSGQIFEIRPKLRVLGIEDALPVEIEETPTYRFIVDACNSEVLNRMYGGAVPEDSDDRDRKDFGGINLEEALGGFLCSYPGLSYADVIDHMEI